MTEPLSADQSDAVEKFIDALYADDFSALKEAVHNPALTDKNYIVMLSFFVHRLIIRQNDLVSRYNSLADSVASDSDLKELDRKVFNLEYNEEVIREILNLNPDEMA